MIERTFPTKSWVTRENQFADGASRICRYGFCLFGSCQWTCIGPTKVELAHPGHPADSELSGENTNGCSIVKG